MRLIARLQTPFRLAPIDLLAAIAIAAIALSLIAGPVLSQDDGASPTAVATAAATSASPAPATPASPAPPASPDAATTTSPSPSPAVAAAEGGASPPPDGDASDDPCAPRPTLEPGATVDPEATPTPPPNLCPAQPGANPIELLAWVFTPIFQTIFIGLAFLYSVTGDIGVSIILLTVAIRVLLIPVFRAQIVSQRRMQMLQPELRAIQAKYKGDRARISQEQMQLYRDRGVNPASGCLPAVLQLVLLLPMYQVFMQGLNAPIIDPMLHPFGLQLVTIECYDPLNPYAPCIDPNIWWLSWLPKIGDSGFELPGYPGGLPSNEPEIFLSLAFLFGFGLSLMALASAALQLVQTRMMMNRAAAGDPQQAMQQRLFLLLPAFSLLYGAFLPAGLFIYWITTTVFSIIQQFLINGYGGLFPIFGWTPRFAVDHQPRFPVSLPEPKPAAPDSGKAGSSTTTKRSTKESAAGTIRPARRRSRRRGRRR